jgi:hypothetical protein
MYYVSCINTKYQSHQRQRQAQLQLLGVLVMSICRLVVIGIGYQVMWWEVGLSEGEAPLVLVR